MSPRAATPFEQLLATKYDAEREDEALAILEQHPELAQAQWTGPDDHGKPFVRGSTALHYAANDGKLRLMTALLERGADPNASEAHWWRSVLAWAANNARLDAIEILLSHGASSASLDAVHAAAWGGSSAGAAADRDYVATLRRLLDAGADLNDARHYLGRTPLYLAVSSGNEQAATFLRSLGAVSAGE